jgi:hypothetical protein
LKGSNSSGEAGANKTIVIGNAPTTVKITKIEIVNLPFTNPATGSGWDQTTGPDIYINIVTQSNSILLDGKSSRVMDVTPSQLPLPWTVNPSFEIADFNAARYIDVWDYDFPDGDDNLGYVGFLMSNYTTGANAYPSSVTETQNGITVKLTLAWQ